MSHPLPHEASEVERALVDTVVPLGPEQMAQLQASDLCSDALFPEGIELPRDSTSGTRMSLPERPPGRDVSAPDPPPGRTCHRRTPRPERACRRRSPLRDGHVTELSRDGGASWAPSAEASFTWSGLSNEDQTAFALIMGWADWRYQTLSLASRRGQSFRLRWDLTADDYHGGQDRAWLDDLSSCSICQ